MQRDFGGQFLCAEARVAPRGASAPSGFEPPSEAELRKAAQGMTQRLAHWKQWADALPEDGSCVLWGAGSKGVMFLNLLGLRAPGRSELIVDQNIDKHGRFVSGTGQEIVAPESLRDHGAREVVLMNGIYAGEVRERLAGLGLAAEVTVAWP